MTPEILNSYERCERKEYLERTHAKRLLHPTAALYVAVEAGLTTESGDPGQVAGDVMLNLAVDRGLDVKTSDLYAHANHLAHLADFLAWVIRGENGPWERPEPVRVGKYDWTPSAFLNKQGTRLRRVLLVDRWSDDRHEQAIQDWAIRGEMAVTHMPLDLMICVLGSTKEGMRQGPFSRCFLHPKNGTLRFRRRDMTSFDDSWKSSLREDVDVSQEQWLETMTSDGVIEDHLLIREVSRPTPDEEKLWKAMARQRLEEIAESQTLPSPRLSSCYDPISPCQFRTECKLNRMPSERTGFVSIRP